MFQFFDSFRSEKKPQPHRLHRTHNLQEKTPCSYQTAVKNNNKPSNHQFSHSSHPNDKIHFAKMDQNSYETMLKRQFFTFTSEIELEGQKYNLLKICPNGQFTGNLMNGGEEVISKECHFALVKKVSSSCSRCENEIVPVDDKKGQIYMDQYQNSLAIQENQTNEHLESIVFQLKFQETSKSLIHILHKGPFISLFEYYLLKCHKTERQTEIKQPDEIKMLVNSVEKWFDDKQCTMELIRDGMRKELSNEKVDQSDLPVEDSFRYRFRSQQDLLSVKFFIVERLTRLAQMKIGYPPKRLINENEKFRNIYIFENQEQSQGVQRNIPKQTDEKSHLQKEDRFSEDLEMQKIHSQKQQKFQQSCQLERNELNIKKENSYNKNDQEIKSQQRNISQIEQTNQYKEVVFLQTNQLIDEPGHKLQDQSSRKQDIVSFSQFQSEQMFDPQVSSNINKAQNMEMQCQTTEKKNNELWNKQNEMTYEDLPRETTKNQKYHEQQTLSNEKTIPEKVNLSENPSIFNQEINQNNVEEFKLKYDIQSHQAQHKQNSPMVEEQFDQVYQHASNPGHNFQAKLSKNFKQFQQTTVNKPQTANPYCSINIHSSNNAIYHMQPQIEALIPKKLTFDDNKVNLCPQEQMDNQSNKNSSEIDNYKIDEEGEEEMGGYEDLSQENEPSFSKEMEHIAIRKQQYEMPQAVNSMQQQVQSLQPGIRERNESPLNSSPLNKQENFQTSESKPKLVNEPYHNVQISQVPQNPRPQQKYQIISQVIKTQKLPKPDQPEPNEATLSEQLEILQNTQFQKSTYSLIRSNDQSILCLQVLKEQGKIRKQITEGPKSKDDLVKLMLYNPLLLQNTQSSHPYHHNKFYAIKSFRSALHKVNKFEISSNEQRALLYSTHAHSHPVVLQYDINTQKFTDMFKIPSLCHKSGLTSKPLPLIKVQYLNNSTDSFCAMTSKEICLFYKNAHKSYLKNSSHQFHKLFVYRNLFAQKKSNNYEFDTFELHQNGRYLVAGVSGRYVRVFDLEKQQQDQMISRKYQEHKNQANQKVRKFKKIKKSNKKQHQQLKKINWEQNNRKTKRIKRIKKINKQKEYKVKGHNNYENYKVYYLKSLNSFDVQNQQNISPASSQQVSPASSQQKVSQMRHQSDSNGNQPQQKIKTIKLIYQYGSDQTTTNKQAERTYRKVENIYCQRDDGVKFLINCMEENRMGIVNCFENKLRLNNRSLIKVITDNQAMLLLGKD